MFCLYISYNGVFKLVYMRVHAVCKSINHTQQMRGRTIFLTNVLECRLLYTSMGHRLNH